MKLITQHDCVDARRRLYQVGDHYYQFWTTAWAVTQEQVNLLIGTQIQSYAGAATCSMCHAPLEATIESTHPDWPMTFIDTVVTWEQLETDPGAALLAILL